jgi:hypothetical protein
VTKNPKVALLVKKKNQSNVPQQIQPLRVLPVIAPKATARRVPLATAPTPHALKVIALLVIAPIPHAPKVTAL